MESGKIRKMADVAEKIVDIIESKPFEWFAWGVVFLSLIYVIWWAC